MCAYVAMWQVLPVSRSVDAKLRQRSGPSACTAMEMEELDMHDVNHKILISWWLCVAARTGDSADSAAHRGDDDVTLNHPSITFGGSAPITVTFTLAVSVLLGDCNLLIIPSVLRGPESSPSRVRVAAFVSPTPTSPPPHRDMALSHRCGRGPSPVPTGGHCSQSRRHEWARTHTREKFRPMVLRFTNILCGEYFPP